jgi:hypothetical protein
MAGELLLRERVGMPHAFAPHAPVRTSYTRISKHCARMQGIMVSTCKAYTNKRHSHTQLLRRQVFLGLFPTLANSDTIQ